jgi:hypothetical protein
MNIYNDFTGDLTGDFYSLENNIAYDVKDVDDIVEGETLSIFDRVGSISTKELLRVMFMIHLIIVVLILAAYYDNKNSIDYSITRLQLLIVITSLWLLLYCFC